ncbi:hypothetical protein FKM82_029458 [Ascaphus truei]
MAPRLGDVVLSSSCGGSPCGEKAACRLSLRCLQVRRAWEAFSSEPPTPEVETRSRAVCRTLRTFTGTGVPVTSGSGHRGPQDGLWTPRKQL